MGVIQIIITFTVFVVLKNHILAKDKEKSTVRGTIYESAGLVLLIIIWEHFFPF